MSARSPIRWLALGVVLASACPGCGGGTGSSSGSEPSTFSGTVVVVEGGGAFKVDVDADFRSDGTVKAELTWAVVAAGSGRFGSQAPRLTLAIFRECIGWDLPPRGGQCWPFTAGSFGGHRVGQHSFPLCHPDRPRGLVRRLPDRIHAQGHASPRFVEAPAARYVPSVRGEPRTMRE